MVHLLLLALLGADPDFPDAEDPLVEDVAPGASDPSLEAGPIEGPTDDGATDGWATKPVKPRDLSPKPAAPSQEMQEIRGGTARSQPAASAAPAPAPTPAADTRAFIAGYNEALWGDSKDSIQRRYPEDRPLLDKGGGKWMITDQCEGEDANVVYAFDDKGGLRSVVCQFKRGVENPTPDHALYQKARTGLVKRFGQPTSTNESPAPDSPSQAAAWDAKAGKATLVYDAEAAFVQLSVERRP